MFALADCNNFYASCHRLFEPQYKGMPVVVLSNNDGCVIARSNEAKALGIPMGAPYYKIKAEIIKNQVAVFSSHYALYGDISARVMTNLARFTPNVEVYSIDECFLGLSGFAELKTYGKQIRDTVINNTGIPISVGIAPTKVLAKVANKTSKKHNGVMVLETEQEITAALEHYPVEDLWGVGRQFSHKLIKAGIETAAQFRQMPLDWVQANMTIVGVRLWRELWGESCMPLKTSLDPKKGMCTSRSFGKLTTDYNELKEATAAYAARLGTKLRMEGLCTTVLSVRLLTNKFVSEAAQVYPSITIPLEHPVNNTIDLVKAALFGLKKIYMRGYLFQKVEVTATGLVPENEVQLNIFSDFKGAKHDEVSKVLDKLNMHYGAGTLKMAGEGLTQEWTMKRQFLRPSYTTSWKDIIKVK